MFFVIYQTTNLINGKIYVGMHKTNNLNDGYMGSGKALLHAIEKYGRENFKVEILFHLSNEEEMRLKEREIVNEEFVKRSDTYNLMLGGKGSFAHINNNPEYCARRDRREYKLAGFEAAGIRGYWKGKKIPTDVIERRAAKIRGKPAPWATDNSHMNTEDALVKKKQTFQINGHQQGEKNSSFGTKWITNGAENMKINANDVIPDGWCYGRVMR